ncbi:MAG: DUF4393 domain-containing protein [Clostridia bacterium]|nr:DUF4393 domain-containing protein [Clostridia bacterium]
MSDELVIEQKQGLGNAGTQVGVQNNYGLSPVEATRMAFEIFREYYPQLREEALKELNNLVEEKLSSIPQELIDSPKPRIAVPTLQNASITEEREVRELYANLLANSMNKVVKNGVHPGFVEIIKQLSPDEAKIIRYLRIHKRIPTLGLKIDKTDSSHVVYVKEFSNVPELSMCENIYDSQKYIDNLVRLGLVERSPDGTYISNESVYEPLKNHPFIKNKYQNIEKQSATIDNFSKIDYVKGYCELTSFGESFCSICLETQKVIILKAQEG